MRTRRSEVGQESRLEDSQVVRCRDRACRKSCGKSVGREWLSRGPALVRAIALAGRSSSGCDRREPSRRVEHRSRRRERNLVMAKRVFLSVCQDISHFTGSESNRSGVCALVSSWWRMQCERGVFAFLPFRVATPATFRRRDHPSVVADEFRDFPIPPASRPQITLGGETGSTNVPDSASFHTSPFMPPLYTMEWEELATHRPTLHSLPRRCRLDLAV